MRFSDLHVGQTFFYASSLKTAACFEKKSKSSAFTLHPVTFQRTRLDGYARPICGFDPSVEVAPFLEQKLGPPAVQLKMK